MALVNTSTTSLLGLLLLTFGLAGTMSAPVSQDWDVDAASGDTNENAIELKNGLLVLVQITKMPSRLINKLIRNGTISRVCDVIQYLNADHYTNSTNSSDTVDAVAIKNKTCAWVNSISEGTFQTCTDLELSIFCLHVKIFIHSQAAEKVIKGTSAVNESQWISSHYDEGLIKDFICSRPTLELCQ